MSDAARRSEQEEARRKAQAEEAAQRARLQHVGYWKRVSELLADGLIEETGDTARSRAGEACRIYRITAAGTAALR